MTPRTAAFLLAAAALTGAGGTFAHAQAPLPYAPEAGQSTPARSAIEAGIGRDPETEAPLEPADVASLKAALDALGDGDLAQARRVRDMLPPASLDRKLIAWAIALSGDGSVTSGEIGRAAKALAGWPVTDALRNAAERAMLRENPAPDLVLRAFGDAEPQTVEGAMVLARARRAAGDDEAAAAALRPFWREMRLPAGRELAILAEFGPILAAGDHRARMEQMLHHDRIASAERVAAAAGAEALAKAWAAVIRRQKDAAALLEAVPEAQRSSGWYFAKARHLRWHKKFAEAAKVMAQAPSRPSDLADPDAWWVERRALSRELQDAGNGAAAYAVAAGHAAEDPATVADAEFHAGWYALRELDDPVLAARHFARIGDVAEGPISSARAEYWLGRAAEAGAPGDTGRHFRAAAAHSTTFYGQIAAARLGERPVAPAFPAPTPEDRLSFDAREPVQAIRRLEAAGHPGRADALYRGLAAELGTVGELALLAAMAEGRGDYRLALRIGKIAAARGIDVGAMAHPVGAIPSEARIAGAGEALAYAVARQESEFNAAAVSPAGARGLLQLLPGTAREMARLTGETYSLPRLTRDAAYNAELGAAFLARQLERFSGSYVLTFVGYNAGPRRARDWVERYGDPRGMELDAVVDWIERIPFTETRNYVQRVMENYQVYKMRLTDRFDLAADLTVGRR